MGNRLRCSEVTAFEQTGPGKRRREHRYSVYGTGRLAGMTGDTGGLNRDALRCCVDMQSLGDIWSDVAALAECLPHGRFVDAGEGDCGGPGNRVSGGAGMPTAQLRPDRQFDIHIEQPFLDIVHREGTIGDDGLVHADLARGGGIGDVDDAQAAGAGGDEGARAVEHDLGGDAFEGGAAKDAQAGGVADVATDSGTVFTVEVPRDPRPQEEI